MGNRKVWGIGLGGVTAALFALATPPVGATPPGENGPIVWQSYTGPAYEIWMMDADGSNKDELTDNSVHEERAQLSADGTKITYQSFQAGDGSFDSHEIYTMNADGSGQTALMDNDDTDFEPTWSPDGSTIVFMRQSTGVPSGEVAGQDLWSVPAAGGTATNLTNTPNTYECCPEFSPDGTKIAFTNSGNTDGNPKTPDDENEIWVMNANGSGQQQLIQNTAQDVGPTWSPSGNQIAWANVDTGVIWTMNADGFNPVPVTGAGGYYAPSWSPDGTRIAAACGFDICSVGLANPTTDVVNLTQTPSVQDEYPNWAPGTPGGGAPDTQITKSPKDVIRKDTAKYEFEADPPAGATFECKLDKKAFKACTSPRRYKNLSNGKHKFQVRASAGGETDPTPAKHTFKVKP